MRAKILDFSNFKAHKIDLQRLVLAKPAFERKMNYQKPFAENVTRKIHVIFQNQRKIEDLIYGFFGKQNKELIPQTLSFYDSNG